LFRGDLYGWIIFDRPPCFVADLPGFNPVCQVRYLCVVGGSLDDCPATKAGYGPSQFA
jgi:hypothetical protein